MLLWPPSSTCTLMIQALTLQTKYISHINKTIKMMILNALIYERKEIRYLEKYRKLSLHLSARNQCMKSLILQERIPA